MPGVPGDIFRWAKAVANASLRMRPHGLFTSSERLPSNRKRATANLFEHGLFTLCWGLLAPLLLAQAGEAATPEKQSQRQQPELVALADAPSTKETLLLFWEEKDLYVTTATRTSKPLSQTAENMVVITAKDIEDMNAHTLADVLNTVPGVFVDPQGQDFGSSALFHIQGSEIRHVTMMLDGFSMNSLADGNPLVWLIPPKIIERIEIVKGPASSAWGSSLGGIINVITKSAGDTARPKGTISASYGEAQSQDYSAELSGKGRPAGYYLFAGRQQSNGIRYDGFSMNSFYGKVDVSATPDLDILFTAGYTDPEIRVGSVPVADLTTRTTSRGSFATAGVDYRVTDELSLKLGLHAFKEGTRIPTSRASTGVFLRETRIDETILGADLRLVYQGDVHAAVAGIEFSRGSLDIAIDQAVSPVHERPDITKWGLFVNDTVTLGKFSITPGVRFDYNDISGSFVSPSLGATYSPVENTVIRASVARGFTTPPLIYMSGGGRNVDPNPGLKEENVLSYQVGAETGALEYVLARVNFFRHDSKDSLIRIASPTPRGTMYVNNGDVIRQGVEAGVETAPIYDVSVKAGFSFVHVSADRIPTGMETSSWDNYSYNLGIKYDDRTLMAQLVGTYVWWDLPASSGARYDDFLWDMNVSRKIFTTDAVSGEIFGTVHNLFNGHYYSLFTFPNPRRWVEAGLRLKF